MPSHQQRRDEGCGDSNRSPERRLLVNLEAWEPTVGFEYTWVQLSDLDKRLPVSVTGPTLRGTFDLLSRDLTDKLTTLVIQHKSEKESLQETNLRLREELVEKSTELQVARDTCARDRKDLAQCNLALREREDATRRQSARASPLDIITKQNTNLKSLVDELKKANDLEDERDTMAGRSTELNYRLCAICGFIGVSGHQRSTEGI
ncbi:Hypothetical protein SMAX5B_021817 [Scophthalmus maximus]|uniref:Uncharacterized protein n=1 Tax=Scophthalmus maximus TaxID=52904 RepID=A0A2U9BHR2_SCOMX|nr:Hypothetical protein SMAX5B_021817 [Scophthalmus maximus]